jgi:hypothetical protein
MYCRGISIIEAMLALALFSFSVMSLSSLFSSNEKNLDFQVPRFQALLSAKQLIESNEEKLNMDFDSSSSNESIDTYQKLIEGTSSLAAGFSLQPRTIVLQSLATDWQHAEGATTCDLSATDTWKSLNIGGSIDLGNGNNATALAARGKYVYLTANSATKTASDFFVIDVSDTSHPFIVAQLDTGPGATAIKVAGNYAYVGNSSINAQLQIIDIRDPTSPTLVSSFKIPGNYSDETTIPNSLFFYDSRLYLGTKKSQIAEFHVIDVSDASAPKELGSYEMNAQVNDMFVEKTPTATLAYVATPIASQLTILDVSDPANIKNVGGFVAPGSSEHGKSIYFAGSILYFGTTKNIASSSGNIYELDVSNPLHIFASSAIPIGASVDGLVGSGSLLFAETENVADNFQIWNVTDSSHPYRQASSIISFPSAPTGLACSGNNFYAALQSNDALRIITSGNN